MAKVDKQKLVVKESPCKPPQPCLDQDYDPCQSGEDITEEDLAVLLKEEQDRLRWEKEKAKGEQRRQRASEAGKGTEDGEGTGKGGEGTGKGGDGTGKGGDGTGKGGDGTGKGGDREGQAGGAGGAGRGRPCRRGKRPPCRKLPETNPFFTDRLGFSSDLPPPPPIPPPQFFPPVDGSEVKICPKRRKKCKKGGKGKGKGKERDEDGTGTGVGAGAGAGAGRGAGVGVQSSEKMGADGCVEEGEEEAECKCLYEDECKEDGSYIGGRKVVKGRCKKRPRDRPPCRKKVSEVSISLQPRHIPALQRDLPATSPKDIPEVVRQILMAWGKECDVECGKRKCKKGERCK